MSNPFKHTVNLPPEQEAIRAKCFHLSGTFVEFDKKEIEQSISDCFEKVVRRCPNRLAVKTQNNALSYDFLNKAANRVARAILDKFGAQIEPAILLSEQGPGTILSCLGILKAGKILIAVDPSFPVERLAYILEDSQAGAVLTESKNLSLAMALAKTARQVVNIDALDKNFSDEDIGLQLSADAPAEIRYTSGSTGQPKGIVRNHRRLLHNTMLIINTAHICPDDRVLSLRNLSFGIKDAFKGLLSGASVFPFDIKKDGLSLLPDLIIREGLTYYASTPSIFRYFISELSGKETFPSLRVIQLGGEPLSKREVESYKKHFTNNCVLLHHLSAGEAGNLCQYFINKETEISTSIVPVGYPVRGKEVFLVDENWKKIGIDQVGEIAVRSRYLSSEYWRKPELTSAKFLPDPSGGDERIYLTGDLGRMLPDGRLVYLGRKDLEVKIRGSKVAITEIEMALRDCAYVKDAAVTALDDQSGEKCLVAYVVPREAPGPKINELGKFLREKLPDYMIPSAFMVMEALPLTNGKLDRTALPLPDHKRPNFEQPYAPPQGEIEKRLVQIWEEVLNVRPIGIHDNFFDLGGHSLLAAKLFACLDDEFGRLLPLSVLLAAPTVRLLAKHYRTSTEPKKISPLVPLTTTGSLPPVYAMPGRFGNVICFADLTRELGSEQPFYGLQSVGLDGAEAPLDSIESMARLYVSEIRKVQPHGPYSLIGACFGARVAYEMARQLLEADEEVAFLGLLDPSRREGYDTSETSVSASRVSKRAKVFSGFVTDRLRLYLDEMRGFDRAERIKFVTNKIRSLTLKIGNRKAFTGMQREMHQLEVFKANKEASKRYHRKPLNGRLRALEIFETARNTTRWSFDWKSLWGGHPIRHHVPGKDSGDMLSGENAGAVAGLLAERLRAAFEEKVVTLDYKANAKL